MAQHIAIVMTLIFSLNVFTPGQVRRNEIPSNSIAVKALSYFQHIDKGGVDNYMRGIRPLALAPELRAKVLKMLPKDDLVSPSSDELAKLKTLEPILKYHQRDSVIELKVLRAPTATAVFLAGAAVLITEPALRILSAGELQAVVAHELGHEYYWTQFEAARQNHEYTDLQELELRCDGIAIITLEQLGLDPLSLVSAITKLNKYNGHSDSSGAQQNYVAFNERVAFIDRMIELFSRR